MHFPTLALLHVILLSILGGPKIAHAFRYEDAFGKTFYGLQCPGEVFLKPAIYAAAKNYCDLRDGRFKILTDKLISMEHRSKFSPRNILPESEYQVIPILSSGKLYRFDLNDQDFGIYRLIVEKKTCYVTDGFTTYGNGRDIQCRIIHTPSEGLIQSDGQLGGYESGEGSRGRSHGRSREGSRDGSRDGSRYATPVGLPEGSPEGSRGLSHGRSREPSPDGSRYL